MKTFEIGNTYFMRSPCDHECIWTYTVVRRTAKSVWLSEDGRGNVRRAAVKAYDDAEEAAPLGNYSMSPRLSAERLVAA